MDRISDIRYRLYELNGTDFVITSKYQYDIKHRNNILMYTNVYADMCFINFY